jgi:DNA-binding transcriptional LysR family regulator
VELRELRALVAVAEKGGVARAARALYLSPSSVSSAITSLETELGVRLFDRRGRGMVLTDVGRAMLGPARQALQDVAAAEAAAAAKEGLLSGRVTVVPGRIFLSPVVAVVAEFHSEHPLIVIGVREPQNERVIGEMMRKGEADFGVMSAESVPSDFIQTPIGTQTEAVIVPLGHPLGEMQSVNYEDLEGVDMIAPEATSPFRPMFDRLCRSVGVKPRIVAESDHLQTIIELVRRGVGATVAPIESVSFLVGEDAVVVPLAPPTSRRMSLVARGKGTLSPAAEALWQFVVQRRTGAA